MIGQLTRLWRMRPVLTSAFLLACAATAFFVGSVVYHAVYWSLHEAVESQPWMTIGDVARPYDLSGREIDEVAGLPLPTIKGHPQPLSEIALDRGVPVEDIIAEVEKAIVILRARGGDAHGGPDGGPKAEPEE